MRREERGAEGRNKGLREGWMAQKNQRLYWKNEGLYWL